MAGDVVALGTGCAAILPLAGETEVVGALAADMVIAKMDVEQFGVGADGGALLPQAFLAFWGG